MKIEKIKKIYRDPKKLLRLKNFAYFEWNGSFPDFESEVINTELQAPQTNKT